MTTKRLLQLVTNTFMVFLVAFALVGTVSAQDTWYVNSTEGDNTNDGSQMENAGAGVGPFATLDYAIGQADDGDFFVILAGTYSEDFDPDDSNAGIEDLSFSVQASGANTIAYFDNLEVDADHAFTGGDGIFRFDSSVSLNDGTLTIDAGILTIVDGGWVGVFDGRIAGANVVTLGSLDVSYTPVTEDVTITTGFELPADGDLDGGYIEHDPDWDDADGAFVIDDNLVDVRLYFDGDIPTTVSGTISGDSNLWISTESGDINSDIVFEADVVFEQADFGDDNGEDFSADVTFEGDFEVTDQAAFFSVDIESTSTITFEGDVVAFALNISGGDGDLDFQGNTTVTDGDFDVATTGDVTTSNVDLTEYDLNQTGGGSFTMNSTLTIGDDNSEADGTRVTNASGEMTIDNLVIQGVDDTGEDGSGADTDEYVQIYISNSDVFTLSGTVTEATVKDDDDGDEDVSYVLAIVNADDALFSFGATTSFSGDVDNSATEFDNDGAGGDDEGIAVASGASVISSFPDAYTALGYWGGAGTLEISEGTAALATLESTGNFILSADRDLDSGFEATGFVTLESDETDVSVDVDIDGVLTIDNDDINFTGGGASTVGGLQVNGDSFTFLGDLDSDGDVNLADGVITGSLTVDGDFTTNDGAITGDFDVSSGDATFDGSTSVGGTVNVEGDVTIPDGADASWADLGEGVSDIEGLLTVDGLLTLTDATPGENADNPNFGGAGTDLTVGSVSIAAPDGEFDVDGVDLILNGSFTGGLISGGDDIQVNVPSAGTSFGPGPNTDFDFFTAAGSGRTLTVSEGFEVDSDGAYMQNDVIVALGDNTITISGGDLTLEDEAAVTTSEPTGAIAFASGGAQQIIVTGAPTSTPTLSNIRVNGGSTVEVDANDGTLEITGDLSLNDGTFDILALQTVEMTGDNATITRNPATGILDVNGGLDGSWNLVYFGDGGISTGEFANGQVKNVTVNMNDAETVVIGDDGDISGSFTANNGEVIIDSEVGVAVNLFVGAGVDGFEIAAGEELDVAGQMTANSDVYGSGDLMIGGSATVAEAVYLYPDGLFFDGTGTVTLNGSIGDSGLTTFSGDYTVNGTDDTEDGDAEFFGDFEIDDAATVVWNIQTYNGGTLDVTDGDLTVNMIDDDNATDGDDAAFDAQINVGNDGTMTLGGDIEVTDIDGIMVDEDGSLTLTQDAQVDGLIDIGNGGTGSASFDIGSNWLEMNGDLQADADAVLAGDGTWEMDNGGGVININGLTLVNLTLTTVDLIDSDLTVSGLLDVDEDLDLDSNTLTLSGDAEFDANFSNGEFETTGTTLTLESDVSVDDFTVNSASTTTLATDDVTSPIVNRTFTVNGDFTMAAGMLDIGDEELYLSGGDFDYNVATGDAITMGSGEVYFEATTWSSDGVVVTLANIGADGTVDMANGDGDGLLVTGNANLDSGASFDMNVAAPGVDASVEFADGSSIIVSEDGVLDMFELDPTLGMDMSVEYDAGAPTTTGNELAASVASLETDGTDLTLADDAVVLVTGELRIDGNVQFDTSAEDNSLTLGDGGLVVYDDAAGYSDDPLILEGDWNVEFDGLVATDDDVWPNATVAPLAMTVSDDVAMHEPRTTVDLNVDAELDVDAPATLTVTGNLFADDDASFITSATGFISMNGTELQMLTFDADAGTPDALEIDNAAGVTLDGSDLDFSAGGTLILTDGPLNTGDNAVILAHGGTGAQGYTRTSGVVNGNVQKYIDTTGANPNRIEFPTGTADGFYRPFAVTFNNPGADIGDIDGAPAGPGTADDMLLTASYNGVSAMGTNGLPITTTDSEGNDLSIGRYPDFHWEVSSSPTISPSVDYDVEFQAEGYDNFAQEEIERTRPIRRQAGATTNFWILTSPVAGDNDNYAISSTEPVAVGRNAVGAITGNGVLFTFGLEQNMVATDPSAVAVNADATKDLDLTTVFSGGDGNYTFAVTSADDATATGVGAANVLTVSGVAAGSTTLTVTATDGFGDTATATVTVNVGEAFAATAVFADFGVNVGAADTMHDGAAATSGGTAPYTYAIATTDATVADAAIDATSGAITLTYGVVGTATITISTTDATGAMIDHSFDVTVNVALGANGSLAAVTVEEGADEDVDASGEFTGGTGTYTYTAASASDANATVAVDGATVTVTGVSAYTVVAGEVTADAAPVTVTVTATDEFGGTTTSTFDADVTPVLGNVDGSGGPSPAGASSVLDHFLGLSTLTTKQQAAADFNMDSAITPFDAALIFDAFFNGKDEIVANPVVDFNYGEIAREENIVNIPVMLTGDLNEVVSASFSTRIDPAMATIVGVTSDLGEGWIIKHVVGEDGTVNLAFAGNGSLDAEGTIATISIELNDANVQFNLGGEGAANNNTTMSLDAVEVAELPETFALHGNYPNPFNPSTSINFDLPESADVEIHVIDMIGRQVMTLPATTIAAGANRTVQIDASRLASGPYFYRVIAKMESKTLVETGRMMLVK